MYIAIVKYTKATDIVSYVYIAQDLSVVTQSGSDRLSLLGNKLAFENDVTPINFSIDANHKIVEDCGRFERLSDNGGVVVGAIVTKTKRILGYRVLGCASKQIVNVKVADIIAKEAELSKNGIHFLQNAIIRDDAVACYPGKQFVQVMSDSPAIVGKAKKPSANADQFKQSGVKNPNHTQTSVSKRPVQPQTTVSPEEKQAQRAEFELAQKNGVDPRILQRPGLKSNQMRVLWVAKSKGAYAEYFNDPRLSTDAMKFYADRLYSKKMAKECRKLLDRPELNTEQLAELYRCIADGVEYDDLLDKSATEINVARESRSREYWGNSDLTDENEYRQKAIGAINHMMFQ